MIYYGINLSVLKEGETKSSEEKVDGVIYMVFRSRNRGSAPFPFGCSSISVPIDFRTDGYWFAGLFQLPTPISQPDPTKLFRCIANFLPHLAERRITLSQVTLDCFQEEGGEYKLAIANCMLKFDATEEELSDFRKKFAKLLPDSMRFKDALLGELPPQLLYRHPAYWTIDEDMHFIADLVAVEKDDAMFKDLDKMIYGGAWASPDINSVVWADVTGNSPYWIAQKSKEDGMKPPRYNRFKSSNLVRFLRNKWVHFYDLDPDLQDVFKGSRYGLVEYCNRLMKEGDIGFSFWNAINGKLVSMKSYWAK